MIITIDGPAASGKTEVARRLAEALGGSYQCLNTGAMYRAVGTIARQHCPDLLDEPCVARIAGRHRLDFDWTTRPPRLLIDQRPATEDEVSSEASAEAASAVARMRSVRRVLVEAQARIGQTRPDLVAEGRDQGSVVFPQARVKFFLTADVEVRARRRVEQLVKRGRPADHQRVRQDLERRDRQDSEAEVGRLIVPPGAITLDSTRLDSVDAVVRSMIEIVRRHATDSP
jgi:cytidylate kinase